MKCIMDEPKKTDKREKQIKDRLLLAMIELSEEKEWSKITITDLINRSHVARASFYRNFDTISDLINYGIDRIHSEYWKNVPKEASGFLTKEMLTYTFEYYYQKRALFLALHRAALPMNILDIITQNMILSFGDMPSSSPDRYRLYYYSGAIYNMTVCWLESGAKETPAQMAEEFLKCSGSNLTV